MSKYIVTIAPPTPNGDLHLGHLSGPLLAADIFARIKRIKNDEVIFVCYSDDYQDYVDRQGVMRKMDKYKLAVHYSNRIEETLRKSNIDLDCFMKTYNNKYFNEAVSMFYQKAKKKGTIGTKIDQVPYDEENQVYGYEAFARGICNYCQEESDTSQCEACGSVPVVEKMGDIISYLSGKKMTHVEKEREYLKLDQYADFLKQHYIDNPPVREDLAAFINENLDNCDLNWFIDRPDANGITITVDGEKKTIHTWFSGVAGYYAATREYSQNIGKPEYYKEFWEDDDTQIVNFLGFDCSFSHAIVYPSLLSNLDNRVNVYPITNRFLKLEGKDFSTSRSYAIWINEILDEVPADNIRFYLALVAPEDKVKNFEKGKFLQWNEFTFEKFQNILENYMEDSFTPAYDIAAVEEGLFNQILDLKAKWNHYGTIHHFSINKLAAILQDSMLLIMKLIKEGNKDVDALIPLYLVQAEPIHPTLSQKLLERFDIKKQHTVDWLLEAEVVQS